MSQYDTVSLISDFGHLDEYVGVFKSVLRERSQHAMVIDICHEIPPHDVRSAALMLLRSAPYLVAGVVVAAVDPGATDRRHIAVELADGESVLIGPDNGLFAPLVAMIGGATAVVRLPEPSWRTTFPARDIYARAAGDLCNGKAIHQLGEPIEVSSLTPAIVPFSVSGNSTAEGVVLHVDRYGNALLNIAAEQVIAIGNDLRLHIGDASTRARVVDHVAELSEGEIGVLVDHDGSVRLVSYQASAAAEHGLTMDTPVRITAAIPVTGS